MIDSSKLIRSIEYSDGERSACNGLESGEDEPPSGEVSDDVDASKQESIKFRKRFFPDITLSEWNNWLWQLGHRIRDMASLSYFISLKEEEYGYFNGFGALRSFPFAVTPYYLSLFWDKGLESPLRKCVIPTIYETLISEGESADPLSEDSQSPAPGLVHRYPDRVLFLATDKCFTYCRYCTRSRIVGKRWNLPRKESWSLAIDYIKDHKEVRDVVISGGDPLTLPDAAIEWLLRQLRSIRHVEVLRIGTKAPVVLPHRITPGLTDMLKRYHPLYMSLHFSHPAELTKEVETAVSRLLDAGIPLGSQTVLLAGVNDSSETLKELFLGLMRYRIRPYYLYQCDPIIGSRHFRTQVKKGIQLMRGLRGRISGYAIPTFVIDAPGGGGKVPVDLGLITGFREKEVLMENFEGRSFAYPDTAP
jgi:lysine 2,3-aminomutase